MTPNSNMAVEIDLEKLNNFCFYIVINFIFTTFYIDLIFLPKNK